MENKLKSEKPGYVVKTSIQRFDGIKPFKENPCEGRYSCDEAGDSEEIPANKLFSLFTADIIKEEVIFTR